MALKFMAQTIILFTNLSVTNNKIIICMSFFSFNNFIYNSNREFIVISPNIISSIIVGYRLSPEEAESPGISMEITEELIHQIANKPLDYIHSSVISIEIPGDSASSGDNL
jgi:hypothetical protein